MNQLTCQIHVQHQRKKIENIQVTSIPANKEQITGYRLVDMEILSFIFGESGCPECCK